MSRWDEVRAGRRPRPSPPGDRIRRDQLLALTEHAGWPVLLAWLHDEEWARAHDLESPNAGALFAAEGRRSLIRRLEGLAEQLSDRRGGQPGDERGDG